MHEMISAIWQASTPAEVRAQFDDLLSSLPSGRELKVFFRADDIGHIDINFERLMHLFRHHEVPLCLAVVPEWIDQRKWEAMQQFAPADPLWCWHQHGRSHTNHQVKGKKSEFGDNRSSQDIFRDLSLGKERLVSLLESHFHPVFTPPWNRCSLATLTSLRDQGFTAVSRSQGARPSAAGILPDLAVNIDLHTRKEDSAREGWQNLANEMNHAVASGIMGFMLHHQRMNDAAFSFLDYLLEKLKKTSRLSCITFREMKNSGLHR